jgi:hypothetical protein
MKHLFKALFFLLSVCSINAHAGNGDTITVVSHNEVFVVTNPSTGSNSYPQWATFPSAGVDYRKIILTLNHKCPPGMPCGEWDYIDNIYIRRVGSMNATSSDIELARYITPYGNSFNQSWGSSWTFDASDFAPFLHDSVEIEYIHTGYETNVGKGWAVTVSFAIIEGTPVMPFVNFNQLWKGSFPFGNAANPIENYLQADTIQMQAATNNLKLKITQSGHGSDAANCAEFCSKTRTVLFDNAIVNTKSVWRTCGLNPIYPQGGTWVYNRANWCPGNWVYPETYKFNVAGGSTHIVDVNMQNYSQASPAANYVVDAQLFEFGALSHANDAAIDEVMEPSNLFEYSRMNPVCNNPRIRLKNNGSNALTAATIKYGLTGLPESTYSWTGNLASLDTVQVILPGSVYPVTGVQQFKVYLADVNGSADQYPYDDTVYTTALIPPVFDSTFVFWFKTNSSPNQNSYKLWDENGNVIFQRTQGSLTANTIYKDTFYVAPGCYRFKFYDAGGDGLTWWANPNQGSGYARFSRTNVATQYVIFNSDFGSEISYNFRAVPSGTVGIEAFSKENYFDVYPNPTSGNVTIDVSLTKTAPLTVELLNMTGKVISTQFQKAFTAGTINLNLEHEANGIYMVRVTSNDFVKIKKVVLQR